MATKALFEQHQGDYKAVLKLLDRETQKYCPGDENILYRLYRMAIHYCGLPTEEMRESPEFLNLILELIKVAQLLNEHDCVQSLFAYMSKHKVGYRDAKRYQKEAVWLANNGETEKALIFLREGLRRGAQPESLLHNLVELISTPIDHLPQQQQEQQRLQPQSQPRHDHQEDPPRQQEQRRQEQKKHHQLPPPQHKALSSSDSGHKRRREFVGPVVSPLSTRQAEVVSDENMEEDTKEESMVCSSTESENDPDEDRGHTQLSPIDENKPREYSQSRARLQGARPAVLSRADQCTPRDASVKTPGIGTPQQHGHSATFHTPTTLDQRIQTPSHDRTTVYVNERPYTKIKVVGRGGSCKVYKVLGPCNEIYAMKRVKVDAAKKQAFACFKNEVGLLEQLRGKENIIQMIDYEVDEPNGRISIVLEYGECDFAHFLMSDPVLGIDEIRQYWRAMLLAVRDIHEARIVHSDLKPQNYMLVGEKLKLIDFGIAKDIPNDTTNIQRDVTYGTLSYMSPEANNRGGGKPVKLGRSSDIWSLGIILYQLVYKRPPFEELTPLMRYLTLSDPETTIEFHDVTERDVPNSTEDDRRNLVSVLQSCLVYNPRDRFTIPQLLHHPLLSSQPLELKHDDVSRVMKIFLDAFREDYNSGSGNSSDDAAVIARVESQVCATFWTNLCENSADNEPFRRLARLYSGNGTTCKTPSPPESTNRTFMCTKNRAWVDSPGVYRDVSMHASNGDVSRCAPRRIPTKGGELDVEPRALTTATTRARLEQRFIELRDDADSG
eukprot:GEMP01008570.1.p1 GENE.GEMP01008570.1~~GEMP01008570.1.p1  ORF type:complete len:780 (+),score=179.31 GEMP01008570.1:75-2414(+)